MLLDDTVLALAKQYKVNVEDFDKWLKEKGINYQYGVHLKKIGIDPTGYIDRQIKQYVNREVSNDSR